MPSSDTPINCASDFCTRHQSSDCRGCFHDYAFGAGILDRIVWLVKNAVTGARVWFAHDGRRCSTVR